MSRTAPAAAPDQQARDRIHDDLASTLFVEAGAGSGKTSALVDRVLELITRGEADLASIAAITFTEKAGAELRDRLRIALEERIADVGGQGFIADWCRKAVADLDGAAIGTLHSFAQRILTEHPVEAGLPPRVEVLDEVSSDVAFDRRWLAFRDELFEDPALERALLLLFASGVRHGALRVLALAFDQNWDLIAERVPTDAPEPPDIAPLIKGVLDRLDGLCELAHHCAEESDTMVIRLCEIGGAVERLRTAEDELEVLELLAGIFAQDRLFRVSRAGNARYWKSFDHTEIRAGLVTAGEELAAAADQVKQAVIRQIAVAMRGFTLRAAAERRSAGQLGFHDLLVLARSLLRDPAHGAIIRTRLHARYQRVLLDEFQDTDPIQIELAVRIAAAEPESDRAGQAPWPEVTVAPGHLFVVGDPKQSIYRFRRADISLFLHAREELGVRDGGLVSLTANFRSTRPIIEWVNATFGALIQPTDAAPGVASQPAYVALDAVRKAPPKGPPVAVIGREAVERATAAELRTEEAREVASTVERIMAERWSVGDASVRGGWRPACLGDITVLVPARTSLPYLEDALDRVGIAFRAESSSLVYASRAVRDLLLVARAVDDPSNHLMVVSALRTPLFACGDDDLFRYRVERGGRWSYTAEPPETVPLDDPVRVALAYLRERHEERRFTSPSELLERIATDRRAFEAGFAEGRPRDAWRRLRFVTDQARGWSEATGGSLRQYLSWVDGQTQEGARVAEAVLPETDDEAVRVMTIHAAKGLEFPITIVSGMSTVPQRRPLPAEVAFPPSGSVAYKFGKHVVTEEFAEWAPIDEQMGHHERIRLLYVACTRAQDHLVVSLRRKARKSEPDPVKATNAELLLQGMGSLVEDVPDAVDPTVRPRPVTAPAPPSAPPPFAEWATERAAVLAAGSRASTVSATSLTDEGGLEAGDELTDGLRKRQVDLDLPPWLKGRYGSAVGRAVHAVLQTIPLATGQGLDAGVASACEAEAIPERRTEVGELVRHALHAAVVQAAATAPHWREVYACTPVAGGRLLEGYVDLLYRSDAGLVVVDYKTAGSSDPAVLASRVEGYRLQGASYALIVGQSTGEPVVRVVFLFLTPEGPVEIDLDDLDSGIADVERLVQAGAELVLS